MIDYIVLTLIAHPMTLSTEGTMDNVVTGTSTSETGNSRFSVHSIVVDPVSQVRNTPSLPDSAPKEVRYVSFVYYRQSIITRDYHYYQTMSHQMKGFQIEYSLLKGY